MENINKTSDILPSDMEIIKKKSDKEAPIKKTSDILTFLNTDMEKIDITSDNKTSDNVKTSDKYKTSDKVIKEMFTMFDRDGDGSVNVAEIKTLISSLGGDLSDKEVTAMVKMADTDKSGDINIKEFRRLWSAMQVTEDEEDIKEEFSRMDPNGDGFITKEELAGILRRTALIRDVDVEAQKCLDDMDINNDGKVTYEEFLLIWKYRK